MVTQLSRDDHANAFWQGRGRLTTGDILTQTNLPIRLGLFSKYSTIPQGIDVTEKNNNIMCFALRPVVRNQIILNLGSRFNSLIPDINWDISKSALLKPTFNPRLV